MLAIFANQTNVNIGIDGVRLELYKNGTRGQVKCPTNGKDGILIMKYLSEIGITTISQLQQLKKDNGIT